MKINTDSVSKQIYEMLKEEILERHLLPGEKIGTREIAEKNHVSIMPVRDALQQLASDGLVRNRERVGFFVRQFTSEEIVEIVEMRSMFELYCLENHMDKVDLERMESLLGRLKEETSAKELDQIDHEFHRAIVYASHNSLLINEYNNLYYLFSLGISSGESSPYDLAREEHIAIIRAILEHDNERACRTLAQHLQRACSEIVELYQN